MAPGKRHTKRLAELSKQLDAEDRERLVEFAERLAGDTPTAKGRDVEPDDENPLLPPGLEYEEEYEDNVPSYIEAAGADPEQYN